MFHLLCDIDNNCSKPTQCKLPVEGCSQLASPSFQTANTHFSWAKLLSSKSACMQVLVQCMLLFNRHDKFSLSTSLCPLLYWDSKVPGFFLWWTNPLSPMLAMLLKSLKCWLLTPWKAVLLWKLAYRVLLLRVHTCACNRYQALFSFPKRAWGRG